MAVDRVANLPVPPHSAEAEQGVLGALLLGEIKTWALIQPVVSVADFYRADHQTIFAAIAELARAGATADIISVNALLERKGELEAVGGVAYLSRLARETATATTAPEYARIVKDRSTMRRMLGIAEAIQHEIHGRGTQSAEELLADAQERLTQLQTQNRSGAGLVDAQTLASELLDDLDKRRERDIGLSIGVADFDNITGGLEPGDLVVFAGRPGMGKSALLVTIGAHVGRTGEVAVFSAEMPARQLARRSVALLGNIRQDRLKRPKHMTDEDWAAVTHGAGSFSELKLWIDETPRPTVPYIRGECVARRARGGLKLVMVDYVQLLEGEGNNRYEQLRDVAYGCKALAKELAIPVILLAQINRGVESRDHKRPTLSDLRDSGAIEEAADIVGMLYSESYYNRNFEIPNVLECSIEKHRNGERGLCLWHFAGEYSRIVALEDAARSVYRKALSGHKQAGGGQQAAT